MEKTENPIFRASEVLDMAVQVEEQGLSFYKACRQAKNPDNRILNILDYLIVQETRHKEIFKRMKSDLEERPIQEGYPGETRSYFESFVKDSVFGETGRAIEQISNMKNFDQAIEFGLRFEKQSIEFYGAVKDMVHPSEHGTIEDIISEEQNHIQQLQELSRNLKNDR